MNSLGEKALLPSGPYIFDVVSLHKQSTSLAGHPFMVFVVRLVGYTYETHWLVSKAAFRVWREFTDDFESLPAAVVGRRFLFDVSAANFSSDPLSSKRNTLQVLAEVLTSCRTVTIMPNEVQS